MLDLQKEVIRETHTSYDGDDGYIALKVELYHYCYRRLLIYREGVDAVFPEWLQDELEDKDIRILGFITDAYDIIRDTFNQAINRDVKALITDINCLISSDVWDEEKEEYKEIPNDNTFVFFDYYAINEKNDLINLLVYALDTISYNGIEKIFVSTIRPATEHQTISLINSFKEKFKEDYGVDVEFIDPTTVDGIKKVVKLNSK